MIRRLNRIRRKYFRRPVWRRWWRGPDRELARREWHWFTHVYLRRPSVVAMIALLCLFAMGSPFLQRFFLQIVFARFTPGGIAGSYSISILITMIFNLPFIYIGCDLLRRRLRRHFQPGQLPHLMLSDVRSRELWPALLLPTLLLVSALKLAVLIATLFQIVWHTASQQAGSANSTMLIVFNLSYFVSIPVYLLQNVIESAALLALVALTCAMGPNVLKMIAIYILGSCFMYAMLLVTGVPLSMVFRFGYNTSGFHPLTLAVIFCLQVLRTLISIAATLAVALLLWRWALRRLRGPQFRLRMQAAMERTG